MPNSSLDRRTLIRTAGAVGAGVVGVGALAACGSSSTTDAAASSSAPAGSAGVTVAASEVPVGGGKILADSLVVVTQPVAGTFKAFGATCTHQGCPVTKVADGKIECPCHGSQFDISTGAPTADSAAKKPLAAKTATVSGANIVIS
ncbi:Rieske (2Fe-2S) protein [Lapillicoccus sp.]|uniref:Rieske (2Fe-2S) protein n=1 Tax=Lapillicoccus sp. TaxID=1909287 RepID=UPI0025DAB34C|nr:Rieske (2Fe-2S) protein [Lapillicoccus sp.]